MSSQLRSSGLVLRKIKLAFSRISRFIAIAFLRIKLCAGNRGGLFELGRSPLAFISGSMELFRLDCVLVMLMVSLCCLVSLLFKIQLLF